MEFNLQLGRFHIGFQKRSGFPGTPTIDRFGHEIIDFDPDWWDRKIKWHDYTDSELITLFHSIPEIHSAVDAIASRVADATWQLVKDFNDQTDFKDVDFNRLFTQPNPVMTWKQLIYQAVCYEICTGKQYFYKNVPDRLDLDYKNVAAIWNLPADKVQVIHPQRLRLFSSTEITDVVTEYKIDEQNRFAPAKVLAINNVSLDWCDRYMKGKAGLLSADKAIQNLIAVYTARHKVYTKGGPLVVLVSKKSDESGLIPLTPKEKEQLDRDLTDTHGFGRGKSIIKSTAMPTEAIQIGAHIKDLLPFEETRADTQAIFSALRVPEELMPGKNATYENQVQAERGFYNSVIIPWAKRYAEGLTGFLGFANYRRSIKPDFSHVDALQENKKEKADLDKTNGDTYLQRFLNGVCTLNQWIIATGEEKITGIDLYDKTLFQMTPDELTQVQGVLKLKAPADPAQAEQPNNVKPINNAAA